tara:strand:+ start:371 stop:1069 length:699 start_codon:yes stop_codon:yes gene_type:complete
MKCFSIVIPIYNEEENIISLIDEIYSLNLLDYVFEIIVVDDNSSDNSYNLLKKVKLKHDTFKLIQHKKNLGQSQALKTGINSSQYGNIVTIDGDGQNDPNDIMSLCFHYFNKDSDFKLVGGERKNRKDSILKKYSSFIANNIRKIIFRDNCNDTGCSLKIFNKKIFLSFPFFKGIHRFLPALFVGYGYKTFFLNVNHRKRMYGVSNYGTLDRLIWGVIDIVRVKLIISKYNK